jgi:hypothetical protein
LEEMGYFDRRLDKSGERGRTSLVKQEFLQDLKVLRKMTHCSSLKDFNKDIGEIFQGFKHLLHAKSRENF